MKSLKALLLVGVLSGLTWAACTCGPTCTATNCSSGCCDPNGFCLNGTANTACGIGGQSCQSCAAGKSCVRQSCSNSSSDGGTLPDSGSQPPDAGSCDQTSCSQGCCNGTSCVHLAQQSGNSCGAGGQACQACDLNSQTCQNGACIAGCGASTCLGCCSGTNCVNFATQSNSTCGYGGEVCRACAIGNTCSNAGLCVLPLDAGVDAGPAYDFPCGNYPPCALSQQCCTTISASNVTFNCVPSCANQNDVIACDGPEECLGANQVCCGTENVNGGSSPNCTPTSLGASCTAAANCPTTFANNCQGTNQVTICHTSQDCPDPNNNTCCAFNQGGASLTFCVSFTLSLFASACF
jgi:hypothetical protein